MALEEKSEDHQTQRTHPLTIQLMSWMALHRLSSMTSKLILTYKIRKIPLQCKARNTIRGSVKANLVYCNMSSDLFNLCTGIIHASVTPFLSTARQEAHHSSLKIWKKNPTHLTSYQGSTVLYLISCMKTSLEFMNGSSSYNGLLLN